MPHIHSKDSITIDHLDKREDTFITSEDSVTIDSRKDKIEVDGNLSVKAEKYVNLIGNGSVSDDTDSIIYAMELSETTLELYEYNKQFGPSILYAKAFFNIKGKGFSINHGIVASKGPVNIEASSMKLSYSIIASSESIYLKGVQDFECKYSIIESPIVYMNYGESAYDEYCTFLGEVKFVDDDFVI